MHKRRRRRLTMSKSILNRKLQNFLPLLFCLLIGSSAIAQSVQPEAVILDPTKPVEREMKARETHVYQLPLRSGQFVNILVEQRGLDVTVDLLDPNEKQINTQDSPNGRYGPESIVGIAE